MLSAWLHWKTSTSSCLVFPGLCCAVLCCSVVSLCDPMNCTPPGSSVQAPLVLQARILEWVAMPSSRVIFPTQGSNPGLLHCRQILYCLSHQRSPRILEWVAIPFFRVSSWPRIEHGSPAFQADSLPSKPKGVRVNKTCTDNCFNWVMDTGCCYSILFTFIDTWHFP